LYTTAALLLAPLLAPSFLLAFGVPRRRIASGLDAVFRILRTQTQRRYLEDLRLFANRLHTAHGTPEVPPSQVACIS